MVSLCVGEVAEHAVEYSFYHGIIVFTKPVTASFVENIVFKCFPKFSCQLHSKKMGFNVQVIPLAKTLKSTFLE